MTGFGFLRPGSLDDALQALAEQSDSTAIVAGGTAIVPSFFHVAHRAPKRIVYVGALNELRAIDEPSSELVIGAAVTLAQLAKSPPIRAGATALAEAASRLASPQVRNRGTLGGNLAAGRWGGELAIPLLALDARVTVLRRGHSRKVDIGELYTSDGRPKLSAGEMIATIEIPRSSEPSAYLHLSRRRAIAPPIVSVAMRGNRIVVGAGNPPPLRIASEHDLDAAFAPRSDPHAPDWYRRSTAKVLIARASALVRERAR